ncbi:hypothetical protein KR51_00018500 [Rubidibacter lacunae KORDI 51-2]|uniref:MnmC-like methyltransferase domain-containing protein n=2 Tax=Rubidibacter TaxID=582491 RepID=U5DM25_9CHRO|nr:hypothetical protein KR51_00018500 [Rubidibacter lacunae KORDI 51-2]
MFVPEPTADGSYTFFSEAFGEAFHSRQGARQEAINKFALPCLLDRRARALEVVRVLDVCYGLGYNTAAAIATVWEANPRCRVEVVGLEADLRVPQQAVAQDLLRDWMPPVPELMAAIAVEGAVRTPQVAARLLVGDARETLQQVAAEGFQADAVLLDPFSPRRCPQLWTVEFLGAIARCLAPGGRVATYSCSAAVRTALLMAGLRFGSIAWGSRSPGTIACFDGMEVPPLTLPEREHLQTRAAVPYRDPRLADDSEAIRQRREREQETCALEATSQWRRRWREVLL